MKNIKKLKLTLMILICIVIILIGFLGIYLKRGNVYKNILPKYDLATDFKGSTILEVEVDKSNNTLYYDKDGNEVEASTVTEENEKDYTKKEVPVNAEENLTQENYEKTINIMKKRLDFLKTDQYRIDLNKNTGKIFLTFEDEYPDDIKSFLTMEAKMELVDSNTKDVILTYTDFINAEAMYVARDDGSYNIYINLKLNDSGIEKIKDIDIYRTTTDSKTEETKTNNFKIMFDTEEIAEVSYDDILLNNKTLRITTAKNLTTNSEINSKLNVNTIVSKLATIGKMPVIYEISAEEYIKSEVSNYIKYIVISIAIICAVILIYFIIKYKSKGILITIPFIANIALFLILIRVTDIQISLNGIAGILGLIVLNTILVNNILKFIQNENKTFADNIKDAYLKTINAFVILLIILIVFAFSKMTVINSMGLLLFWGWIIILFGNLILTVPILSIINKK